MELRKLAAIAFSSTILAAQAYVVLPGVPKFGDWYYPFIDYPMYSVPRYASEPVRINRLMARPCDSGSEDQITSTDLGVRNFALYDALDAASGFLPHRPPDDPTAAEELTEWFRARSESARGYLSELVERRWPGRYCSLAVIVEEFYIARPLDVEAIVGSAWRLTSNPPTGGSR